MHQQHSKRRQRRHHSAQFKAQLVDQCVNGGASVSATAVDNGINPNLLRRWVLEHERLGLHALEAEQENRRTAIAEPRVSSPSWPPFISVTPPVLPAVNVNSASQAKAQASSPDQTVRIELGRNALRICLDWPVSHGRELGQFMRELLT